MSVPGLLVSELSPLDDCGGLVIVLFRARDILEKHVYISVGQIDAVALLVC